MIVTSEQAQTSLGARLLACLPQAGLVYLQGDLGTGKTTLIRGLLRAAGVQGVIRSPTYSLCELYRVGERQFAHLDLYRLGDAEELEYLGLRDWLGSHLIFIEWPQVAREWLGEPLLQIELSAQGEGRQIRFLTKDGSGSLSKCIKNLE